MRADEWHAVAARLDVSNLYKMMTMSREFFHLFVADRAWLAQRHRVCARFPKLVALFEEHANVGQAGEHMSEESVKWNSNKKRKTAWLTPRSGIWFVFKRWLCKGKDLLGYRELLRMKPRSAGVDALIYAVLREHIPHQDRIIGCERKAGKEEKGKHCICLTITGGFVITFKVAPRAAVVWCKCNIPDPDVARPLHYTSGFYEWPEEWMIGVLPGDLPAVLFEPWSNFLTQQPVFKSWWTEKFVDLMRGSE